MAEATPQAQAQLIVESGFVLEASPTHTPKLHVFDADQVEVYVAPRGHAGTLAELIRKADALDHIASTMHSTRAKEIDRALAAVERDERPVIG
jgi:hypothetical protein